MAFQNTPRKRGITFALSKRCSASRSWSRDRGAEILNQKGRPSMTYKSLIPCIALAMAGFLASCGNGKDDDFVTLDQTWDSSDNAFNTEYSAVRAEHDRMTAELTALAADSTRAAQAAEARTRLDA